MEIADIPSEVWFLVPFEHNEGLIKELECKHWHYRRNVPVTLRRVGPQL
jgi:hypothetical protein